jgi:uncharacterized glyoxalase superfamily protein PhnB
VTQRETDPQVIPYLLYEDAGAAMDWLTRVFGFAARARHVRPDGSVRHGELILDRGGVVMVGSPGPAFRGPRSLGGVTQLVRVTLRDLTIHRDRTRAAGVEATPIESGPPEWISYTVTDPEGHQWYFTQQVGPEAGAR